MAQKSQHVFTGLDTDTADRFLKEGSFRDSLNIHIGSSEGDGMFSVENVKGNTLVNYALPAGTNQVIGAHEDITNKCIYFFLCNSSTLNIQSTISDKITTVSPKGLQVGDLITISGVTGRISLNGDWIVSTSINPTNFTLTDPPTFLYSHHDSASSLSGTSGKIGVIIKYAHSILKYDSIANSISQIYKHSRLNFNKNYPITGTALLNGVLHWTDNYNPPRSLTIDAAFIASLGNTFDDSVIDFIRIPPTIPVTVTGKWVNSSGTVIPYVPTNTEINNMDDKSYQFIYRYVYNDNTRSVWSPVSETIVTGYNDSKINKIELIFPIPILFGTVITSIEFAFRNDILGSFKFVDRITSNPATYNFFNDTAYSLVDLTETEKFFDSIPNITGAMASVQNRVFIGDCTEGFDVNKNDFSAINIISEGTLIKDHIVWKNGEPYDVGIVFFDRAERKSGAYKLFRISMGSNVAPSFTMQGKPPLWATHYRIVTSTLLSKSFFVQGYFTIQKRDVVSGVTSIFFNNINGDLSYNVAVGDILYVPSLNIKYPILSISSDQFGNPTIRVKGVINSPYLDGQVSFTLCEIYTINTDKSLLYYETPRTYQIENPGTNQRSFIGTNGIDSNIKLSSYVSGDVYYRNLNDSLAYHAMAVMTIDPNIGNIDVINFYQHVSFRINGLLYSVDITGYNNDSNPTLTAANALVAKINAPLIGRTSASSITTSTNTTLKAFVVYEGIVNKSLIGVGTANDAYSTRIVIYDSRTGPTSQVIISDIILAYPSTPEGVSGSSAQNFKDNNFVYAMTSNDVNTNNELNWQKNIGRPNIILVDGDKQIRRSTLMRFGGDFLTNTRINFVNSFDSLDQEQLTNFGAIRKLIPASNNAAEGTILLAVQENEISSCYIGQAVITNANGTNQLVSTDKVIGTVNALQKLVGTVNPESVVQYNGLVYGFDALKGVVWRYGQNGLDFISDNGMRRFFYDRSQYLLSLGTFKCYGGIDPYHNEYIISIPNTDTEKITVAWSETLNRWTSFMSYLPEWYQKVNTHLMSFINGQTWLHRSNTLSNNYYGVQYKSKLRMICNKEPDITKILQIVEQKSTSQWDCTEITTPEGQNSELLGLFDITSPNTYPQDFRKYDNTTYVGPVLRDKNTPNLQTSDYPLLKGDVIRSDIFSIKMENSKTTKENLYFVNLMYIPSYKKA